MNYLDGKDEIGQKIESQRRAQPKRKSQFFQSVQPPVQTENGENSNTIEEEQQQQQQEKSEEKVDKEKPPEEKFTSKYSKLKIFQDDPQLEPFLKHFHIRQEKYEGILNNITKNEGSLIEFARSYKKRGIFENEQGNIIYKEWAPGAKEMYLTGDFCDWDRKKHKMEKDEFGTWSLELPKGSIPHNSKVKTHILSAQDQWVDRIPVYIRSTIQHGNSHFDGIYWNPVNQYVFKNQKPKRPVTTKIYECHIGMAGIDACVHSFDHFREHVLPRVKKLGYNTLQIMAIAEHPYYGSFGYHVSLPFGISSRFGTPDQFKHLVDEAHALGIQVLVDIVHSHAASNTEDGINSWDGTDSMYFHSGDKGYNKQWDSKLYDYGKYETLRLLLSNVLYYLEEYQCDGFRFDGITSMLYLHHGIGFGFTGGYHEYFNENADMDSLAYLTIANLLIKQVSPDAVSIAEDVSGYPTLCRPVEEGGVGFDFRLQMAVPDKWIKLLKEIKDEEWNIGDLIHTLTNRRHLEPCIAYAESHDQALVGDKTLAMWLFDKEIYENMSRFQTETLVVSRGMALHKMIRLITLTLGGEGYLNFMGNEFGHPEWIDFPREGNNWSYHHCRRRWDICDDELLRYKFLYKFDRYMNKIDNQYNILGAKHQYISLKHEDDKIIVYEKDDLILVFNFHSSKSFENYKIGVEKESDYIIVLDSDEKKFGGQDRLKPGHKTAFPLFKEAYNNRKFSINLYIPCRTCMVLAPVANVQPISSEDNEEEEENK